MNPRLKSLVRRMLPTRLRMHRVLSGPLRGCKIITSWRDYPAAILGTTERPLLRWLSAHVKEGEVWLDVGAHYGYTSIALGNLVGPHGLIFAFEPVIRSAGCISDTCRANGLRHIIVIPTALGEPASLESMDMSLTRGMAESAPTGAHQEPLLVTRFDWLWPAICRGRHKVHGIKIDVQGMELSVLRGMRETLRRDSPFLVIEFHEGVNRSDILQLLDEVGYLPTGTPIEPAVGEGKPMYLSDKSYAFVPRPDKR